MGRTIIQPIGPLYGEAVNGTVFGRPNGSIYIPQTNQISLYLSEGYVKNNSQGNIVVCSNAGVNGYFDSVAKSQDIAAYIRIDISDDPDFDTEDTTGRSFAAGQFNLAGYAVIGNPGFTIVNGSTYYCRTCLVSSTNIIVAVSDTQTLTGVVI